MSFSYNDKVNEKSLINRSLKGDGKALEQLVKNYQDFIYNISLRLFLNPDDALDATQEVLIKVITHLKTFKGESNFKTWVYRIAFNHFLNAPKKNMEKMVFENEAEFSGFSNSLNDN